MLLSVKGGHYLKERYNIHVGTYNMYTIISVHITALVIIVLIFKLFINVHSMTTVSRKTVWSNSQVLPRASYSLLKNKMEFSMSGDKKPH